MIFIFYKPVSWLIFVVNIVVLEVVERDVVVVVADENVVVLKFGRSLIRKEQIKKKLHDDVVDVVVDKPDDVLVVLKSKRKYRISKENLDRRFRCCRSRCIRCCCCRRFRCCRSRCIRCCCCRRFRCCTLIKSSFFSSKVIKILNYTSMLWFEW